MGVTSFEDDHPKTELFVPAGVDDLSA